MAMRMEKLAINGGAKVRSTPFPPWPAYGRAERSAADAVLASGRVNQWTGEHVRAFEREYATHVGRRHAIAVANGTVAIELALRGFGVGPGDEVIVPCRTFIATASAVVAIGATPILADIDPVSGNVSRETLEPHCTPRTRALIPVHLGGWPCEMDEILSLARERGIRVIEDCAQAHGAEYRQEPVGAHADAAAFSFCQDKIITTGGEGGLVALDDDNAWSRSWAYKDHGKSYEAAFETAHPPGYRWLHESFGTNWRLTEFQASIGRIQLAALPEQIACRRTNATVYGKRLPTLSGLRVPEPPPHVRSAYYRFYVHVEPTSFREGWDRDRVVQAVVAEGIPISSGSASEIYLEKAFHQAGLGPAERFPVAREFTATTLALPTHPTMTREDAEHVCISLEKVLQVATRS